MTHDPTAPLTMKLAGDYDLARREEVAALFGSLDGNAPVVLDFTEVTYIDSTILRELAMLRLRDEARSITVKGARPEILHVLRIVNFHTLFIIAE